jgi:undecaprenyl-diphosphatase
VIDGASPIAAQRIVLGVAALIFAAIALGLAAGTPIARVDLEVAAWFHAHAREPLTAAMRAVSWLHQQGFICVWGILIVLFSLRAHKGYDALFAALAIPGGMMLNVLLKLAFRRMRPSFDDPLVWLDTYSFPSGHTLGASVLYGTLFALFASRLPTAGSRRAAGLGAIAAVVLVGLSRIYLGAHYLSDVLAAAAEGLAWVAICAITVDALRRRRAVTHIGTEPTS